jgi:hypothetical protein
VVSLFEVIAPRANKAAVIPPPTMTMRFPLMFSSKKFVFLKSI